MWVALETEIVVAASVLHLELLAYYVSMVLLQIDGDSSIYTLDVILDKCMTSPIFEFAYCNHFLKL